MKDEVGTCFFYVGWLHFLLAVLPNSFHCAEATRFPRGGVEPPRLRLWGLDLTSISRRSRVASAPFHYENQRLQSLYIKSC